MQVSLSKASTFLLTFIVDYYASGGIVVGLCDLV